MCKVNKVNSYSYSIAIATNSSVWLRMFLVYSVLISPLHVQAIASVTHHPLLEAILHGCNVIATYDKVDLFNNEHKMWRNI